MAAPLSLGARGGQGHCFVGLIAANHLSAVARQSVEGLIGPATLADVSSWADWQVTDNQQTARWHYLDIPPEAAGYDRDRDCPRQPGVAPGSRADTRRDCAVDRITYFERPPVAHTALDRATALEFLVHFIGDLRQPFHALGVGRGGNDVPVRVVGQADCGDDPARPSPCNLHSTWDSRLIGRRNLADPHYLAVPETLRAEQGCEQQPPGTPADRAVESWALGKEALVAQDANVDEAYYAAQIPAV